MEMIFVNIFTKVVINCDSISFFLLNGYCNLNVSLIYCAWCYFRKCCWKPNQTQINGLHAHNRHKHQLESSTSQ